MTAVKNRNEKVAVLLPVYGGDNSEYFELSLKSIQNQSYPATDIILLIDGPPGKKLEKTLSHYHSSVKNSIRSPENIGLAAILNKGLDYCFKQNYEFIARMDADDISLPDRIEKQVNFLLNNPEVDVVGGAIEEIDEQSNSRNKIVEYPASHKECFEFFSKRDPVAHPAVMFRKSFFDKAGKYSAVHRKNQDTFLWYKGFLAGCHFSNIKDVVLQFRITDEFFQSRRGGWPRATKILKDRIKINRQLGYGPGANAWAIAAFGLTVSPSFLKKIAYRFLR